MNDVNNKKLKHGELEPGGKVDIYMFVVKKYVNHINYHLYVFVFTEVRSEVSEDSEVEILSPPTSTLNKCFILEEIDYDNNGELLNKRKRGNTLVESPSPVKKKKKKEKIK